MWRRAFQVAVAASFVLCIAVHLGWLRSYSVTEQLEWRHAAGWQSVRTGRGHLQLRLLFGRSPVTEGSLLPTYVVQREPLRPINLPIFLCPTPGEAYYNWRWGEFSCYTVLNFQAGTHRINIAAPFWFLAFATLALPLAASTRRLRQRRSEMRHSGTGFAESQALT